MQSLDIISVNIWQILISLCNLLILFLLLKKFLFKPVKGVLDKRKATLDEQYSAADTARMNAEQTEKNWNEKIESAQNKADELIKSATGIAEQRSDEIIAAANTQASGIINRAKSEVTLERKKAEADIKHEIADVSTAIAGKILDREISKDDHRELIDSFINNLGDDDE